MQIEFSRDEIAFQEEVRAFLEEAFTPELRASAERQAGVWADFATNSRWHKVLYDKGWVAPSWPKEYGGPGWTIVQRYIFESECYAAGAPILPAVGLRMCGPVLMRYGTEEQKAHFLPRILSGEHYWCQGYSEPQSGSDLAALQCRAVRDGENYVVNGSKIWTTHAQHANWIFMLVRTSTEGKPQAGITFLLAPMNTPGISVRPILSMSGEHEVNQVFFDDVRVPVSLRVGAENEGWTVAKALLEFERGRSYAPQVAALLSRAKNVAAQEADGFGGRLADDPDFSKKMAELEIDLMAVDCSERRIISRLSSSDSAGDIASSMLKLQGSELLQTVTEFAVDALGCRALADQGTALYGDGKTIGPDYALIPVAKYLNARAATIYGGTNEIQRDILARIALGL